MQGDISRATFDPRRHYTRVLAQQGRVQLDSDWNEQVAISLHHVRTVLADLLGPGAGPSGDCGFALVTDPAVAATLTDDLGRPLSAERVRDLEVKLEGGDFLIGQGRYYVHGVLAECDSWTTYTEQLGYPFDDETTVEALRGADGLLVYLDVWERHLSPAERPEILDVALGGADTATRAELVWQVRVLRRPGIAGCGDWPRLVHDRPPLLRARARGTQPTTGLPAVAARAGYRGTENRLYRVEIHRGGHATPSADPRDGATFTWSRENGSVVFAVRHHSSVNGRLVVTLDGLADEARRRLEPGHWVELVDDASTLRGTRSPILCVEDVDLEAATVVLTGKADETGATPELHPVLRRWDHEAGDPAAAAEGALLVREATSPDAGWIDLEDGVGVQFPAPPPGQAPHQYRTGDYWLVPARTATGDVIWPTESVDGHDVARPRLPDGTPHHVAPLAVASVAEDGSWTVATDCRQQFEPGFRSPGAANGVTGT